MFTIGCHLSAAKGFLSAGLTAVAVGANTFQFFTRNPRGGGAKKIDEKDIADFLKLARQNRFGVLTAHAPYTLNAASADELFEHADQALYQTKHRGKKGYTFYDPANS